MSERVLVMNGQRLLQSESDGKWVTNKVDKAGQLKPGIYRLDAAQSADKSKAHLGVIVHADRQSVFQQSGQSLIRHDADAFAQLPTHGTAARIEYVQGKATCEQEGQQARRGIRR